MTNTEKLAVGNIVLYTGDPAGPVGGTISRAYLVEGEKHYVVMSRYGREFYAANAELETV